MKHDVSSSSMENEGQVMGVIKMLRHCKSSSSAHGVDEYILATLLAVDGKLSTLVIVKRNF